MSSYLEKNRLQDIIGALQIMGSYKKYKMPAEKWAEKIENPPLSANNWEKIFNDHPEFFRKNDKDLYSLMWRRGLPHDVESSYRVALTGDQISSLVDTAIRLHANALDDNRHESSREEGQRKWETEMKLSKSRWRQQMFLTSITAFLAFSGAVLAAWIKLSGP